MKRGKFLKWLEKEAAKLPPETYIVNHRLAGGFKILEADPDEEADLTKTDGEGNEVKLKVANRYQQPHLVNHYRRLKRGFERHGFKFIDQYFRDRGFITTNEITNGESNKNEHSEV